VGRAKSRRRPGGHPAKVAARRERAQARRLDPDDGPESLARLILLDSESLTGALDAELWASRMLGKFWEQRVSLPLSEASDSALVYGGPLVEEFARLGGTRAYMVLRIIEAVEDGELGLMAGRLAGRVSGDPEAPPWLDEVGNATITAAAVMRDYIFDDGFTVFLEARHRSGETHTVGVYIDNNLGRMAKDILFADSIDRVAEVMRENPDQGDDLRLDALDPATAAAEALEALVLTEMTLDPPVSEDYAALRAIALLRAYEAPANGQPKPHEEIAQAQRDALYEEFLSSPEGREFKPDGDPAYAVSLAIDCCCDYVDGRPLRWSPVVVELFMTSWVPRKVLTNPGLLEAIPAALDAWIRFAGRKQGLPDWAIAERSAQSSVGAGR
jgi:hypothetical protein